MTVDLDQLARRYSAEQRLAAVGERDMLADRVGRLESDLSYAQEIAREMMAVLEVIAPDHLRDIPRRIMSRRSQ